MEKNNKGTLKSLHQQKKKINKIKNKIKRYLRLNEVIRGGHNLM